MAGFTNFDAISNEALAIREVFHSWGCESEIFSETKRILPELRKHIRNATEYVSVCKAEDVVLLHLSVGSLVNDIFASLPCQKAILYHNVTPSHYFDLINKQTAYSLSTGRNQARTLVNAAKVNMADSKFNANELTQLGYRDVEVFPPVINLDKLHSPPDRKILKKFGDGRVNVLFVGRCVPNKKIEDVLKAFFYFHRFVEPNSRFIHAGSFAGTERYYYMLLVLAREIGPGSVHFAGCVTQSQLNAFYQCANIFLCMSEHEGFCIPVIESMIYDIPVMAYNAAAVPETMDGAGILLHEKQFDMIAEMMGRLTRDAKLRSAIIRKQQERLDRLMRRNLASELRQHLEPLLET